MGVTDGFAFYLVAIENASSLIGRIFAGRLADRIGARYLENASSLNPIRLQAHSMS